MGRASRLVGSLLMAVAIGVPGVGVAQSTVVLPLVVIRDADSDVVAPVISIELGIPVALYHDTTVGGRKVAIRFVSAEGFNTEEIFVYYTTTDCTGQAYLIPPETRAGLRSLTGTGYGIGLGAGGDIFLFRADSAGPGASTTYNSMYDASQPDFDDPTKCVETSANTMLVTATGVLDISTELPPPYTVD